MFDSRSHRWILALVALLIFGQVFGLWPSSTPSEPLISEELKPSSDSKKDSKFKGFTIPENSSPDYQIQNFRYVSVQDGKKQWQLESTDAQFFTAQNIVLTSEVQAELYSNDLDQSPAIQVVGREARYFIKSRKIEVGGNVVAKFPDGSILQTDFLTFDPITRNVFVPNPYSVYGTVPTDEGSLIEYRSLGLKGALALGTFQLVHEVEIAVNPAKSKTDEQPTIFTAARAELKKTEGILYLFSDLKIPGRDFVTSRQSGATELHAQSRRMEIRTKKPPARTETMFTAQQEVRIEEWKKGSSKREKPFRHSTSGKSEFFPERSEFVLTEYPQLYQGDDTLTGESIRVDRKNDQVEVENSNAISRGNYE